MTTTPAADAPLLERVADLRAHEPATFAAVERFVEELRESGVAQDVALARALDALGR
ncbi:MAG: hypothetical protein JWN17_1473 [Frankiales bacterium]|nr:hypothetical protein [Frankiales bacterium]